MADPIVTITNGVPTSSVPSSGTITTLGMTLVDGANATLGATSDAAASGAGTINAHLRSIATSVAGTLTVTGTVATSGTTTVTGTVTANQGSAGGTGWKVEGLTTNASSALSTSTTNVPSTSFTYGFNGTTWDQLQVDGSKNLKVAIVPALPAGANVIGGVTQSAGPWTVKPDGTAWAMTSTSANVNVTNASIAITAATLPLPSGAATSAKQPALGTAGSASADVITVQGIASMTALKVDGTGGTFPVSGTVAVSSISGTVSLPTGAATSANQPSNAGAGSTTSGQTGTLAMGAVTTAAPSYTNATTNNLSLTTTGALRIDGTARLQDGAGNAITSDARGSARPLAVEILDGAGSQVTSFGGSNASVSTTAAAVPGSATYVGVNQGGNLVGLTGTGGSLNVNITGGAGSGGTAMADEAAFTFGTTQGTPAMGVFQTTATSNALTTGQAGSWQFTAQRAGFVNLRNASGTEIGTSTTPLRDAPDGTIWALTGTSANVNVTNNVTVAQTTAANLNATVVGTVTANQGGAPWSATVASVTAPASTMNSASATGGVASALAAVFDDVSPTAITENNFGYIRMSANRNQYTTIRDAAGNERGVNVTSANALVVDGTGGTFPVTGTVTVAQPTAANLNATVVGTGTFAVQLTGATNNINNISGTVSLPTGAATAANQPSNIAQGATTAAQTGTLAMGLITTGNPTYVTGQINGLSLDTTGALRVNAISVTSHAVTQGTSPWACSGNATSGASASGIGLILPGWVAATTNPTAVSAGQAVTPLADKVGKLIVAGAIRTLKGRQKTSITVNTATTVVTAGAAGVFNDVYAIVITNKSITSVTVDINDGAAVVMTLAAPASDTRGFTVPVDSAIPQSGAAAAWTATVSSAVTSIEITMLFVSNT